MAVEEIRDILYRILEEQQVTHAKLDGMEQRMNRMEQRMDGMEQRMNGMEKWMAGTDKRLEGLEVGFSRMEKKIDGLETQLHEVAESVNHLIVKTALNEKEIHLVKKIQEATLKNS
ncbi:hypothetical protein GCM10011571_06040 [Marinithermofilum abyssi]|uniref:Uncharacterized protein n=1 Tax=Marinithermofilum abyssi TaxID=1571185 RepID=A0A8J2VG85_9BACL|nr:hypothetical protein [Marinithermofilum abyssi]GGE07588.1 hypothetical protein GCM10011571_06040 [Marinithermofilum abyssi]